jgi:hypothetical protein
MSFTDTSASAREVQLRVQQGMTGERRLLLALEMSLFVRELTKEGIRHDHPDWSESDVAREMIRLAFLPGPVPFQLR